MRKLNILNTLLIIVIILLNVGCSTIQKYGNIEKRINAEYVNSNYEIVSRPDLPQEVILQFTIIPGAIWGQPLTGSQYLDVIDIGSSLNTNFSELQGKIESFATPMLNIEANQSLQITPKDTKLARFGTFTYNLDTKDSMGSTGFGSPNPTIHVLVLTYFDQPAELKGIQNINSETFEFNIKVESKGLVWLKVERTSQDYYIYSVHKLVGDEFLLIHPSKQMQTEI